MTVAGYKFTALTGGGAGALDGQDGAALAQGDMAVVMVSGSLYHYELNATSGATESSPGIIAPDANAGTKRWILQRVPQTNSLPVGAVIPFVGGYFTNGSNAGFTNVIGDTAGAINTLLNADGWYACNGAALNLAGSSIFNGAGRYLPNLTDDRFLMGSTGAGSIGGTSDSSHTHTTGSFTLTNNEIPPHKHRIDNSGGSNDSSHAYFSTTSDKVYSTDSGSFSVAGTESVGGGAPHNHGSTGAASVSENRPKFLACHYIMKVI